MVRLKSLKQNVLSLETILMDPHKYLGKKVLVRALPASSEISSWSACLDQGDVPALDTGNLGFYFTLADGKRNVECYAYIADDRGLADFAGLFKKAEEEKRPILVEGFFGKIKDLETEERISYVLCLGNLVPRIYLTRSIDKQVISGYR